MGALGEIHRHEVAMLEWSQSFQRSYLPPPSIPAFPPSSQSIPPSFLPRSSETLVVQNQESPASLQSHLLSELGTVQVHFIDNNPQEEGLNCCY